MVVERLGKWSGGPGRQGLSFSAQTIEDRQRGMRFECEGNQEYGCSERAKMIYDISPPITESLKVWPGDVPPSREVIGEMGRGGSRTNSILHATVHLGAHIDAPSHFSPEGLSIDQVELDPFIGPCQVIRVETACRERLLPGMLKTPVVTQRVLFATGTYPDPNEFNDDFAGLSPKLIDWLHDKGVKLVGIDTPSIDVFAANDLPSHRAALEHKMAILEGLLLDQVPEGMYELIALPLRLVGFDASPVRAVLRTPEVRPSRRG
jgi:arylformamidase